MAESLADTFIDDLDDLGEEEEEEDARQPEEHGVLQQNEKPEKHKVHGDEDGDGDGDAMDDDLGNDDDEDEDDDEDGGGGGRGGDVPDEEIRISRALQLRAKERHAIGSLRASTKYQSHLGEIHSAAARQVPDMGKFGQLEDDPEYKLVVSCNRVAQDIDQESDDTFLFITELYGRKFPELEALVPNKLDYVKAVMRVANETDISTVQLHDLLPSAIVMIISVSGSTTSGKPLSEEDLRDCLRACQEMLSLEVDKQSVLSFVESRMQRIAPNLCHIVGARLASQLVGLAGGIIALSKIPACNVEVLGHDKRTLAGLSTLASKSHYGILVSCDLVQSCAAKLRRKCIKTVAAKVTLAARVDSYKNHTDGAEGQRLRRDLDTKLEKWAEPDKARTKKALPVPEEKRKSRRGGKRVRKTKERYAMTDVRAAHNKISFSLDGGEYGDSAMGFDVGLTSLKDTGKLRAPQVKKKEVQLSKKMKKAISASSGQTNGLSSSIVFTPAQGFELRPNAAAERVAAANAKWFDVNSGFMSAAPK